jgi:predicted metalloprotease with PDZ domain
MNEYEKKDRGVGAGRIRCDRISHRKLRKDTLKTISHAAVALLLLTSLTIAQGQRSAPQPVPLPPAIQQPKDVPYPGVIRLEVDATDLAHRVYHIRETIPVASSGPMVLLYPQWIPGTHAPDGPLHNFAALRISAGGKPLKWTRDTVDVYAFHVDVPSGAKTLEIESQYLTPVESTQGGPAITSEMLRLDWYATALYPAGYFTRQISFDASLKLPDGWQFGTALDVASGNSSNIRFKAVSFEILADSPVIAGKYFRKIDLDPGGRSRVTLNVMADEPGFLDASPQVLEFHRKLVRQADTLFGTRHFDHYDFLLSLSDRLGTKGIEHQRSSDNGTGPHYFSTWETVFISRDLLAHEYTHSWNGKYRRPADLWTPNFNVPMRDSLLWVYEGQTQYWGQVLASRSGFLTRQQSLDNLAGIAAQYDARAGRLWRSLQDTTNDPIIARRRAIPWTSWQRSEDYYWEGLLLWLDADTLIRERSAGKRSLDDFARAFFGVNDGDWGQLTYTFDDVVRTLNAVEPYDWTGFLRARLDEVSPRAPLDGLARGGYKLVYSETPTDFAKAEEIRRKVTDLSYSLGATIDGTGKFTAVLWDGPAFRAGFTTDVQIVAINSVAFDGERLRAAVKSTKGNGPAIELLVKQGDQYRTVRMNYHEGLRYPRLERIDGSTARLDDILTPR